MKTGLSLALVTFCIHGILSFRQGMQLILQAELASWNDHAGYCNETYNGRLVSVDSKTIDVVIAYSHYVWKHYWKYPIWNGLFVSDVTTNPYTFKWQKLCKRYTMTNLSTTEVGKKCTKMGSSGWSSGACNESHYAICQNYTGPCLYEADRHSDTCALDGNSTRRNETSLESCKHSCLGAQLCWAVTYDLTHELCWMSFNVDPYHFDAGNGVYTSPCANDKVGATSLFWKRCYSFNVDDSTIPKGNYTDPNEPQTSCSLPTANLNTNQETITSDVKPMKYSTFTKVASTTFGVIDDHFKTTMGLIHKEKNIATTSSTKITKKYVDILSKAEVTTASIDLPSKAEVTTKSVDLLSKAKVTTESDYLLSKSVITTLSDDLLSKAKVTPESADLSNSEVTTVSADLSNPKVTTESTDLLSKLEVTTEKVDLLSRADVTTAYTGFRSDYTTEHVNLVSQADVTSDHAGLISKADVTTGSVDLDPSQHVDNTDANTQTPDVSGVETTCQCQCKDLQEQHSVTPIEDLIKWLKYDKKETSLYKRSLVSAEDNRPSAKGIGLSLGLGTIIGVISAIVIPDMVRLVKWLSTNHGY